MGKRLSYLFMMAMNVAEDQDKFLSACKYGKNEDLRDFLAKTKPFNVNQADYQGNTGLHFSASSGEQSCLKVEHLMGLGSNPSARNDFGETPAHMAAKAGNLDSLKFLVDNGGLSGILMGGNFFCKDNMSRHNSRNSRWPSKSTKGPCELACKNIIQTACEARNTECVEYLVDEILKARRSCLGQGLEGSEENLAPSSTRSRHTLDIKEFLSFTVPRQVVFFELGFDLASSNLALTMDQLEKSLYGIMLNNTPRAFLHLLNSCIFTVGKTTYVDFLPFYNPEGGSELSILRVIIHLKKFELLTHPLCELFLHLKWLRARSLYWIVLALNLIFTFLTIAYVLFSYGNMVNYFQWVPKNETCHFDDSLDFGQVGPNASLFLDNNYNCYGKKFKIPLLACSSILALVLLAKMSQDRAYLCNINNWRHRPEDLMNMIVYVLIIVDQFDLDSSFHRIIGAFLVLGSCRTLMHTIARDPDIAIFVEMVDHIKTSMFKFFISYVWLFLAWVVAFHVVLGTDDESTFRDLGSSVAKVLTMFTGELGFESTFSKHTRLDIDPWKRNIWILLMYSFFIIEMCVILMNLTIGLSISNIQDLRKNADGLRLVKEVLLQRYLESLLHLTKIPFFGACCSWRHCPAPNLGQLVVPDIYNCNAIYTLQNINRAFDYSPTLKMIQNENQLPGPIKCSEIEVPSTVVIKLKQLLESRQEKDTQESQGNSDLKTTLEELKSMVAFLQKQVSYMSKTNRKCKQ